MSILDGIQPGNRKVLANGVGVAQSRDTLELVAIGATIADDPSRQRTILTLPNNGSGATAWAAYSCVVAASGGGFSLGNGTVDAWWRQTGPDTIEIAVGLAMGTTTNLGTGTLSFSIPATWSMATTMPLGVNPGLQSAQFSDFSTPANNKGGRVVKNDSSSVFLIPDGTATAMDHLTPFTWGVLDVVTFGASLPVFPV